MQAIKSKSKKSPKRRFKLEAGLFLGLLAVGIVLIPIAIYLIGGVVFGDYGDQSFGKFFSALGSKLLAADKASWFLVLSPYLGISVLRLMVWGWKKSAQPRQTAAR